MLYLMARHAEPLKSIVTSWHSLITCVAYSVKAVYCILSYLIVHEKLESIIYKLYDHTAAVF